MSVSRNDSAGLQVPLNCLFGVRTISRRELGWQLSEQRKTGFVPGTWVHEVACWLTSFVKRFVSSATSR